MLSGILSTLCITLVFAKDKPIILQFEPDTVADTVKSFMSSKYVKTIVNEFAAKAAEQFIKELEKKQKDLIAKTSTSEQPLPNRGKSASLRDTLNNEEPRQPLGVEPTEKHADEPVDAHNKEPGDNGVQRGISPLRKINDNYKPLNSQENHDKLLALMEAPPADGDNLEDEMMLTDLEGPKQPEKPRKSFKINGKQYYRASDVAWI